MKNPWLPALAVALCATVLGAEEVSITNASTLTWHLERAPVQPGDAEDTPGWSEATLAPGTTARLDLGRPGVARFLLLDSARKSDWTLRVTQGPAPEDGTERARLDALPDEPGQENTAILRQDSPQRLTLLGQPAEAVGAGAPAPAGAPAHVMLGTLPLRSLEKRFATLREQYAALIRSAETAEADARGALQRTGPGTPLPWLQAMAKSHDAGARLRLRKAALHDLTAQVELQKYAMHHEKNINQSLRGHAAMQVCRRASADAQRKVQSLEADAAFLNGLSRMASGMADTLAGIRPVEERLKAIEAGLDQAAKPGGAVTVLIPEEAFAAAESGLCKARSVYKRAAGLGKSLPEPSPELAPLKHGMKDALETVRRLYNGRLERLQELKKRHSELAVPSGGDLTGSRIMKGQGPDPGCAAPEAS